VFFTGAGPAVFVSPFFAGEFLFDLGDDTGSLVPRAGLTDPQGNLPHIERGIPRRFRRRKPWDPLAGIPALTALVESAGGRRGRAVATGLTAIVAAWRLRRDVVL